MYAYFVYTLYNCSLFPKTKNTKIKKHYSDDNNDDDDDYGNDYYNVGIRIYYETEILR